MGVGGEWFAEIMWPFSVPLPILQPSCIFSGWPSVWREFTHFVGRWFAEIMWPFSLPLPHMQPCSICKGCPSVSYFCACKQRLPALWMFNDCDCTQGLYNHNALRWFPPQGTLPLDLDLCSQLPWPLQPVTLTLTYGASPLDHILYLIFSHTCWPCLWHHWYRLLAAFMVFFLSFFYFQVSIFNRPDEKSSQNLQCVFFIFDFNW